MNHVDAEGLDAARTLRVFLAGTTFVLISMVCGVFGIGGVVYSQSGPPPDPELNSAAAEMNSFERVIKSNPSDSAARKGEVDAAVKYSLAEKQEHREEAALWLLLRAKYWVPDDPQLLVDLGVQEDK